MIIYSFIFFRFVKHGQRASVRKRIKYKMYILLYIGTYHLFM